MKCKQCGYDHRGWAFESEYETLCVKCGSKLDGVEEIGPIPEPPGARPPVLNRFFNSLFKRRKTKSVDEERGAGRLAVALESGRLEDSRFVEQERVRAEEMSPSGDREVSACVIPERSIPENPKPGPVPMGKEETDPESLIAYKESAHILWEKGRHEEAVERLKKAIEIEPDDPESWGELGRIYYDGMKDYTKSIECSLKALSVEDGLVWVHCNLCLALLQDNQFDKAKKGFLRIIRLIQDTKDSGEEYRENMQALLHDSLGRLYSAKKEASGTLLAEITDIIELLELERIYFH